MKITHADNTKLILENVPWMMGQILVVLFIAFGIGAVLAYSFAIWGLLVVFSVALAVILAMFFFAVRRAKFVFDKPSNQLLVQIRHMIGIKSAIIPLKDVKRIWVNVSEGNAKKRETYRLEIIFTETSGRKDMPTTLVMANDFDAFGMRDQINDWLTDE